MPSGDRAGPVGLGDMPRSPDRFGHRPGGEDPARRRIRDVRGLRGGWGARLPGADGAVRGLRKGWLGSYGSPRQPRSPDPPPKPELELSGDLPETGRGATDPGPVLGDHFPAPA